MSAARACSTPSPSTVRERRLLGSLPRLQARSPATVADSEYSPSNATIVALGKTDGARRAATLQAIRPSLRQIEHKVSSTISPHAQIWLDEFNWGGDWGGVTWPGEGHGALRGLVWAACKCSSSLCDSRDS